MGGGSNTTTENREPWSKQIPYLEGGFQQAADLYNQGPQLPALSNNTTDAWKMMTDRARTGSALTPAAQGVLKDTFASGDIGRNALAGMAAEGIPAASAYGRIMGTNYGADPIANRFSSFADTAGNNPGMAMMAGTAGGAFLNSNPYIDSQYGAAANALTRSFRDATMPGIQGGFARAGRFGSGLQVAQEEAAQRALGESLGDLGANMYGQNYAQERQNMLAAQQGIGQLYQGGQGLALNALNSLSGRDLTGANLQVQGYQQDMARRMAAASNLNANALSGIGMAPTLAAADYADASALLGLGQQQESYLNAANEAPWAHLARLQGAVSGNYGGTVTTTKPSNSNPLGMIGGLGLMAAGAFTGGATLAPGAMMFASSAAQR